MTRQCWGRGSLAPASNPCLSSALVSQLWRSASAAASAGPGRCCPAVRSDPTPAASQLGMPPPAPQAAGAAHLRVPRGHEQPGAQGAWADCEWLGGVGVSARSSRQAVSSRQAGSSSRQELNRGRWGRAQRGAGAWAGATPHPQCSLFLPCSLLLPSPRCPTFLSRVPILPQVNSYIEFRDEMLPRIRKLGYNAIQIMAIQVR